MLRLPAAAALFLSFALCLPWQSRAFAQSDPSAEVGPPVVGGPSNRQPAPGNSAATVDTVAGPGFCPGSASRIDPESKKVGALAVDSQERIYFDSGRGAEGIIGKIDVDGRVKKIVSGVPAGNPSAIVDSLPSASRLVPDGEGGVIIAAGANLQRVDSANSTSIIAGDPRTSAGAYGKVSSGDGGSAKQARFKSARSLALDESGNLYIADEQDRKTHQFAIRVINNSPVPLTFFPSGPGQVSILPGNIDTIVGKNDNLRAQNRSALRAVLKGVPPALAVEEGRLYVSASLPGDGKRKAGSRLYVVNLGGDSISAHGKRIEGGQIQPLEPFATNRKANPGGLPYIPGLAAGPESELLLAAERQNRILKLGPSGELSVLVGERLKTRATRTERLPNVKLSRPYDVKIGVSGAIYISERTGHRLLSIDDRKTVRTLSGKGLTDTATCLDKKGKASPESLGVIPQPAEVSSVTTDNNGNVYFSAPRLHQVKRLDRKGTVTTVAGSGIAGQPCPKKQRCRAAGDGGRSDRATLITPNAIALGPRESLYVLDDADARVRLVNLGKGPVEVHGVRISPGRIKTIAGNGRYGSRGDNGKATRASLGGLRSGESVPTASLAVGRHETLFIVDRANQRIRQVDRDGTIRTAVGKEGPPNLRECCSNPVSVALDHQGNLYVGDGGPPGSRAPRIWFVNMGGKPVVLRGESVPPGAAALVAGNGSIGYSGNGKATDSNLSTPAGLALDKAGNLYISGSDQTETDPIGNIIGLVGDVRRVDKAGFMTLVAGNGQAGFNGDGLIGPLTSLNTPGGIAFDRCGDLLIAETRSDRVRRLELSAKC